MPRKRPNWLQPSSEARKKIKASSEHEDRFAFQCRAYRLPPVERQYLFAKEIGRKHRFDFAWPLWKIAVEIDGGIWIEGGGAHSHPVDIVRNMIKGNDAVLLGWSVLHYTPDEVRQGIAIANAIKLLALHGVVIGYALDSKQVQLHGNAS